MLLHGEESVVYADAGYQGIAKRPEMEGKKIQFRVAMRTGQRRVLPDTAEGRLLNLIEMAKAHMRAKGEHPFRVIKQQFGFQKSKAEGHGEKQLQGACVGSSHESVFGSQSSTHMHTGIGMVCLLGLIRHKKAL